MSSNGPQLSGLLEWCCSGTYISYFITFISSTFMVLIDNSSSDGGLKASLSFRNQLEEKE